jgi:hypothetical protein
MWEDDKASGPGTLEYHNGDVYEGDWESDQRNGTAQYSHPTTVKCHFYRSILRTILRCLFLCHRRVTHYLRIRIQLQLQYHQLLHPSHFALEGVGKFTSHVTGITYFGSWRDGLKHGPGTLTFPSGDELSGRWSEVTPNTVILHHTLPEMSLQCTVLHCNALSYTVLPCIALSCTALSVCKSN